MAHGSLPSPNESPIFYLLATQVTLTLALQLYDSYFGRDRVRCDVP